MLHISQVQLLVVQKRLHEGRSAHVRHMYMYIHVRGGNANVLVFGRWNVCNVPHKPTCKTSDLVLKLHRKCEDHRNDYS